MKYLVFTFLIIISSSMQAMNYQSTNLTFYNRPIAEFTKHLGNTLVAIVNQENPADHKSCPGQPFTTLQEAHRKAAVALTAKLNVDIQTAHARMTSPSYNQQSIADEVGSMLAALTSLDDTIARIVMTPKMPMTKAALEYMNILNRHKKQLNELNNQLTSIKN